MGAVVQVLLAMLELVVVQDSIARGRVVVLVKVVLMALAMLGGRVVKGHQIKVDSVAGVVVAALLQLVLIMEGGAEDTMVGMRAVVEVVEAPLSRQPASPV